MCRCTCTSEGSGSDPRCPVCHPKKGVTGKGKPWWVRNHASDPEKPAEEKQHKAPGTKRLPLRSEATIAAAEENYEKPTATA
jgi:hypothetical protein